MKAAPFIYVAPSTVDDAVATMAADPDARVLAGGQSLTPLLAMRLATPSTLVDLGRIPGLSGVTAVGDELHIGAMTTQSDLERSELVADHCPLLVAAIKHVGHPAIRARGTIGGSIAHADPAAELPAVMLALDARVVVVGLGGSREVAAKDLVVGAFTTALRHDEVIVGVRLPTRIDGWSFLEVSRRVGDFALALVAVTLALDDGVVTDARVAVGGATRSSARAVDAERSLVGSRIDEAAAHEVARVAASELAMTADILGSADYRRHLVEVLVRRAVARAAGLIG